MRNHRTIPVLIVALALAFPLTIRTDGSGTKSGRGLNRAPLDAIVDFGDPVTLAGNANHVVVPDDTTIRKGGTITFIVNGNGHGIAIYPVSRNTTREDITDQLCEHDPATHACVDPAFANGDHTTRDGKNNVVIVPGANPPFQRIDDPTNRLLGTTTQIDGVASPFLPGTSPSAAGTQLQFRFEKSGRYLVVCMNRSHYLTNWMFGFVNVADDDDNNP